MVLHIETHIFALRTNREHSRHSHIALKKNRQCDDVRCFAQELFPQASCLSKGSTSAPSVRALKVASCITLCRNIATVLATNATMK